MSTFVIVDKKTHNEISVDASNINLNAPSIVHTKLYRDDVAEFIQDGNNLILKLKNGKTIVVANYFIKKNEEESELVFEDEDCGIPWLPFLLGGAGAAGAIAALASDSDGDNTTKNTPPSVVIGKEKQPTITGESKPKTGNITDVKDPDGDQLTYKVTTQPKNGTVTIDAKTGEYTYTPNKGFNGEDTFTVTVDDGKGGTTTIEVPVSVIPAAEVEVTGYEDNLGNTPVNIDSGKSTRDNKPVISGIAKHAKTVEVTIADDQGNVVKTLTVNVDKNGKWATPELPTALKDGDYTITAKAKDALGNEVASKKYVVTVDTKVDAGTPEIITDKDGSSTITTTVDPKDVEKSGIQVIDPKTGKEIPGLIVNGPDANGKVTITGKVPAGITPELKVTDKVGNEKPVAITDKTPAATVVVTGYEDNVKGGIVGNVGSTGSKNSDGSINDGFTNDNVPKISGTSSGASTVEVFIDGISYGKVPVAKDGSWELPESAIKTPLTDGQHTITAKATNGAGKVEDSNAYTVTVDTTVDAGKPHIEIDQNGKVTITTTVDPDDHVEKVEIVDKDGNPVLDVDTKEPLVGTPDADGKVVIKGKLPPEITTPELKVTDKAGNTTKVPTPFILEDEKFDGKIVAGGSTGSYSLSNTAAILDPVTGKYTLSTANGSVILDSTTGEYTYTPNKDFSGSDTFTVSVSNDKGGIEEVTVPIFVTAVADAPLITDMDFDINALALNKYVWKGINGNMKIGGKDYIFSGKTEHGGNGSGNGIKESTLVKGIDALFDNKDQLGERKPFEEGQTSELHSGKDSNGKINAKALDGGDVVLINGLVYLEAGKTYMYKGAADDTGVIIIGNGLSSQYVSWKMLGEEDGATKSSEFTVNETGFYDFNLYVHNENGDGNFDFKVTETNGTDVKYYPNIDAVKKELPDFIQIDDTKYGNGTDSHYGMKYGYSGYETETIKLEKINPKLTDTDGSETLTVTLSNVPAGTTLTVTSVDSQDNETKLTFVEDGTGKITIPSTDGVIEYKDFILELAPDAKVGTETIKVDVTATEKSNADSKSDSFEFEMTIKDIITKPTNIEAANNGDNEIIGFNDMPNLLVGDQGGTHTNFVATHDYNVAIVLDVSGSMYYPMDYRIQDGPDRMTVAKEGLKLFVNQMVNHQGKINFTLITFDYDPKTYGTFEVTKNNLQDIFDTIDNIPKDDLGTAPEVGFDEASKWFKAQENGFENQTYFVTDGDPSFTEPDDWKHRDNLFSQLADQSKVFAIGLGEVHVDNVKRYDNTDEFGNKIDKWSPENTGSAQVLQDKDSLISYLISGTTNFKPAEAGDDTVTGGNGNDILFGDAINTNHLQWDGRDSLKHPQYSGYSTLIDYLKSEVTNGAEPTEQQIYAYLKENYMDFVTADANDPNVKGGNDTIDGGVGDDIIIAGAGNDLVIASQGNDIISTGPGNDTVLYKLLSGFENENTGGHGVDTWVDFALGNPATNDNADVLKFSEDFFTGLKMEDLISNETVGKFITVDYDAESQTATISVDRDGEGSGYTNETLLHLTNQDSRITLDELLENNQIVIG